MNHRPNDWEKIVKAQSAHVRQADFQEKSLTLQNKKNYSEALEKQLSEKAFEKVKKMQAKEQDALSAYSNLNDYNQFKKNNESYNRALKKQLHQDLASHIYSKELDESRNSAQEFAKDLNNLKAHQSRMDKEKAYKESLKKEKESAEISFINLKKLRKEREKKLKEIEKATDLELVRENIEGFNRRDREYQEMYEEILRKQNSNAKSYLQAVYDKETNEKNRQEIMKKWEFEDKQKAALEEQNKIQKQNLQKHEEIMILQRQIDEKALKKQLEKAEQAREKEYIDAVIIRNKKNEAKAKEIEKTRQENYRQVLNSQSILKKYEKFTENVLTEKEHITNFPILELYDKNEKIDFRGIPGIYKSVSPLRSSLSASQTSISFFSNINQPNTPTFSPIRYKRLERKTSESVLGQTRHNPITNPIGEISPCRSFHRGRGLSTLKF